VTTADHPDGIIGGGRRGCAGPHTSSSRERMTPERDADAVPHVDPTRSST